MRKKIYIALTLCILFSIFTGCDSKTNSAKADGKLKVVVSFNAIYSIASEIGGDKVQIENIVPKGTEAHDFEPKPKDMLALNEANIFIYNGLDMESWVENTLKTLNNDKLEIVEATKNADLIKNENKNNEEHHGEFDPHVWLSLKDSNVMANNIKEAFIKLDEKNRDYYEERYKEFSEKNLTLLKEYEDKFEKIQGKSFVTSHAAFAYLCKDFNLKQNSVAGIFNEGEPTSQTLTDIVEFCKQNNVKTIFMELEGSNKVAQTIAKEIDGNVEKINTLESEGTYFNTMKDNLEKIYTSLK